MTTVDELVAEIRKGHAKYPDNYRCRTCQATRFVPHGLNNGLTTVRRVCWECEAVRRHDAMEEPA